MNDAQYAKKNSEIKSLIEMDKSSMAWFVNVDSYYMVELKDRIAGISTEIKQLENKLIASLNSSLNYYGTPSFETSTQSILSAMSEKIR